MSAGARCRCATACNPPKPPPITTTRCRLAFKGLADSGEQIAASLLAAATNLGAHAAVVMVGRVAFALLGTHTTRDDARLECGAYDAEVGFSLTGHDPPS